MANYRKIWWLYGTLLGGAGAVAVFLVHAQIQTVETSLEAGPFLSFELIPMYGVCVALAALYLPVLLLSDLISRRSLIIAMVTTFCFSLLLATLALLKKHFELGPEILLRGWNIYLYALVMGSCCLYGWQKSKSAAR